MTTINYGKNVSAALDALCLHGEITAMELMNSAGIDRRSAHAALNNLATRTKSGQKRAHIVRWVHDHEGARKYPRAVYALGDKRDAPKPKRDVKATKRAYYDRIRSKTLMNSVFNLGLQWRAGK